MPLIKGKSQKSFVKNLKTELEHGHPMKQSLAIAYSMKRKAQHKAKGGEVKGVHEPVNKMHPSISNAGQKARIAHDAKKWPETSSMYKDSAKNEHEKVLSELKSMPKPKLEGLAHGGMCSNCGYSEGGEVKGVHEPLDEGHYKGKSQAGVYAGHAQTARREAESNPKAERSYEPNIRAAKRLHAEKLEDLRSMPNPKLKGLSEGGEVDGDMVDRIISKRYSEGGKVANNTHDFEYEFDTPAQYDDLALRDDLEFHDTGVNSGDELGDAQEDHDRNDIVARIMKSRKKKDRLPNPA